MSTSGAGLNYRGRSWPRKNTPEQIAARQARLRALPHWDSAHDYVWDWPRSPAELGAVLEGLTAHLVLPVSVVGPVPVELGSYHLDERDGSLIESGRGSEDVYVPLAHSEGGLSASMQRGVAAVLDAGAVVRSWVLHDRITRDSCFLFATTGEAVTFSRWVACHVDAMRAWLHDDGNPLYQERVGGVARLSRHARLWEVDLHVLGPACHVLYRFTTGEACGPNMMTRNAFALNEEFGRRFLGETGCRPLRVLVEANMGGDKKPSAQYFVAGGHGKTVLAEVSVGEATLRRVLRTTSRDLVALEHLGLHGSHASDMQSVAFTPASTVAALFATTGQDLGMVGTSSMAHDVIEALPGPDAGIHAAIRFAGLEVGTVGGGTGLPHARAFLSLLGCVGPGSAYRLAQIIAAAALCLELSAAAAASTQGSADFARAHLVRSGRG
jgi:hydroxymethylglutaryl-CoA reductase (NADPH)